MRNVNYADKMKASYFLYSKGGAGAVAKTGGTKISDGCIIVPSELADEIIRVLTSLGVQTIKTEIFINPDMPKSWQTQNRIQTSKVQIENPQHG
jgi:hypothetical protein